MPATMAAGGVIQGDIRMNGHPKVQATFARVSGYVEQFDVHSPQTTVREALLFSAQLRTQGETKEVITAFVDEVMDLVELTPLRDGLVSQSLCFQFVWNIGACQAPCCASLMYKLRPLSRVNSQAGPFDSRHFAAPVRHQWDFPVGMKSVHPNMNCGDRRVFAIRRK